MSEREGLRREFSFENAIPNGPWYTFDTEKALDEIAALRSQLAAMTESRDTLQVLFDTMTAEANKQSGRATTAERERDEAREQLRLANIDWANCAAAAADHRAEADALSHRVERAERVVEAAHAIFDAWTESEDWEAHSRLMKALAELRALDAAEGKPNA